MVRLFLIAAVALSLSAQTAPPFAFRASQSGYQITGDLFQIYDNSISYSEATLSTAQTNAGVWGCDEGPMTKLSDGRIFGITGDCVTAYLNASTWYDFQVYTTGSSQSTAYCQSLNCLGVDTMFLIPAGANYAACNHNSATDAALKAGTVSPNLPYSGTCPVVTFITNPAHTLTTTPAAYFTSEIVSGLSAGQNVMASNTPTGMAELGTTIYVAYNVATQARGKLKYQTQSVLLSGSAASITSTSPPALAKITNLSVAPSIPTWTGNVAVGGTSITGTGYSSTWATSAYYGLEYLGTVYPISSATTTTITLSTPISSCVSSGCTGVNGTIEPDDQTSTGKFMFTSIEAVPVAAIPKAIRTQLPASVQSATNAVFFWGSSFLYRGSSLYLGVMPDTSLATATNSGTGVAQMYYLTGVSAANVPTWTLGAESTAVPLLTRFSSGAACVGEHSVRYQPLMNSYLAMYGSAECGGIQARTAPTPWGPWGSEMQAVSNGTSSLASTMMRLPGGLAGTPVFNTLPTMTDPLTTATANTEIMSPFYRAAATPYPGNPYGPYQYPASTSTLNSDKSVTVYFNISGFNAYQITEWSATFAIPSTVTVVGTTATQALLRIETQRGPCAVNVSQGQTYSGPGVNDVNATMFPGSNSTSRAEAVTNGTEIFFPVGEQTVGTGTDALRHSRALQQSTLHAYSVTCGSDAPVTGNFTTAITPMGDMSPRFLNNIFNSAAFANWGWPSIDFVNQSTQYIDPFTGVRIQRMTGTEIGGAMDATNEKATDLANPNATWTNIAALGTGGTGTATYSGTGTTADYFWGSINTQVYHAGYGYDLANFTNSLDGILVRLTGYGSDASAANRTVNACIFIDDPATCYSNTISLVMPQTTGAQVVGPGTLTNGAWIPAKAFTDWGMPAGTALPTTGVAQRYSFTATASASSTVTFTSAISSLTPNLQVGTPVHIVGSGCSQYGVTDLCTIAALINNTSLVINQAITVTNATAWIERLGVKFWKSTATGSLTLSALGFDVASGANYRTGAEGSGSLQGNSSVSVTVDASGNPLATPVTGWTTFMADASGNVRMYLWIPSTGEMRPLANLSPPNNPSGYTSFSWNGSAWVGTGGPNAADAWGAQLQANNAIGAVFPDGTDPYTYYTTAIKTGGKPIVMKYTYTNTGHAGCNFQAAWTDNHVYGSDNPCMVYTDVTPASAGKDLFSQFAAFDSTFSASYYNTMVSNGGPGRYMAIGMRPANQGAMCKGYTIDKTTWTVVARSDSWSQYPTRWGGCHGAFGYVTNSWGNVYLDPLEAPSSTGTGQYNFAISSVVTSHVGPGNAINATNADASCPSPTAPAPTPPPGSLCITIQGLSEPVNTSPSSADLAQWPWPHNSASCGGDGTTANCYSYLQPVEPGDVMIDPANGSAGEHFTVLTKGTASGTITLVLWRGTSQQTATAGCASPPQAHASTWTLTMWPTNTCNGNSFWFTATDATGANTIVDESSMNGGHTTATIQSASQDAVTGWSVAGWCYQAPYPCSVYAYRTGASLPGFVGSPYNYLLGGQTFFAATTAGSGLIQYHPDQSQLASIAGANESSWMSDMHPIGGATGSFGADSVYAPTVTATATTNVYQVTTSGGADYKRLLTVGFGSSYLLQDKSGPGSVMTSTDYWKFCYAYLPGECVSGSTAGQAFVNAPSLVPTSAHYWTNEYNFISAGAITLTPLAGELAQHSTYASDPTGLNVRRLGYGMAGPTHTSNFSNAKPDAGGQWVFYTCDWCDGVRQDIFGVLLPPWRMDSVSRATFSAIPVQVPAGANARIRFGYNPSLYCTQRTEFCATDGTGATPYLFASETQQYTSCASGCTINLPALPGKIVYYVIDRLSGASSPMHVTVSP